MSFQQSYDFTNIRIEHLFIGYLVGKGLDYLFKRFKISIKKVDIQNNWTWIRLLFIHGFSFIALASISNFFRYVKLEPISKLVWRLNRRNFTSAIMFFGKKYPEVLFAIDKKLQEYDLSLKLEEITGIKKK